MNSIDRRRMTDTSKSASPPPGKIGRLTADAKGLVEDTREWVDAKLRLFELDLEEKLDGVVNKMVGGALVLVLASAGVLFGLVAAALALGVLFDSTALGFAAVAGALFLVAAVLHFVRPRFVKGSMGAGQRGDRPELKEAAPAKQLPSAAESSRAPAVATPKTPPTESAL